MRKYWLTRDGNPGLILFMLGWAADHHAVEHLAPEGYDMLCVYDYRTLEPFAAEEFSAYRNVTLFAWSFGVWAAERTCRDVASDCAVALGGTPYPVDDRFGIPRRAFLATLRGLRGSGAETFNRRAYGADYDRLAPFFDERPKTNSTNSACCSNAPPNRICRRWIGRRRSWATGTRFSRRRTCLPTGKKRPS